MSELRHEILRRSFIALALSAGALTISSCGEQGSNTPSTLFDVIKKDLKVFRTSFDSDGDGAQNALDPFPDHADPLDWDRDGILNPHDQSPYDKPRITVPSIVFNKQPVNPTPTSITTKVISNQPTSNKPPTPFPASNSIYISPKLEADRCDLDSDHDGLANCNDRSYLNPDLDGDHIYDGYDPNPDWPNDKTPEWDDGNIMVNDNDQDNDGWTDFVDRKPYDSSQH